MELTSIGRGRDAFQQPLTAVQISALCERAFGPDVSVRSAVELGNGGYNTTYRIDLGDSRVILRVAPAPERQCRSERELLRNEYAALPYFAPIAALLPRTLAADFTHDLIGRDYLFQSELAGVPVPEGIERYPRPAWVSMYRQLGSITRRIHDVRGPRFGPIAGRGSRPGARPWSPSSPPSRQTWRPPASRPATCTRWWPRPPRIAPCWTRSPNPACSTATSGPST